MQKNVFLSMMAPDGRMKPPDDEKNAGSGRPFFRSA
jgi:hypothetical protein